PEGGTIPVGGPTAAPIPAPPFSAVFGPGAAPPPTASPAAGADVLNKGITIRAHKPTNSIFVRHYANDLERIKKLIREALDIPLTSLLPVSFLTGLPIGGNAVNLLPSNLPTGGISFGIIGTNFNLNLALQALENQTKSRSLSKPEIVTVENAKASIVLGSEI